MKELEAVLPARREELRQLTENTQAHRQELAKLEGEVGHLHQLREWQKANPDAEARIKQMMADLERSKSELAALQQKLAQDEARLTQVTQEVKLLTDEKARLDAQTAALRKEAEDLQKQKAALETTLRGLDDARRNAEILLSSLKNDIQAHETLLNKLAQQVIQAEKDKAQAIRERKEAEAARDAARAELTGLQKSIETLKAIAEGIRLDLAKSPALSGGDYADLFAPVAFPELRAPSASQDERQLVDRARDYIRGKGLFFPERVLHAFHTSLKASDISPLVVLAGISGTGKSELPRHYADGMGLHFLLMSVQPRWDSPQDLFGFYNYLEKRYKATELARAMVQFELFNQGIWELPEDAEIEDRSDRMLLVLLDEMNLARTEYYFSEFLSKLETRRMVNEENDDDRSRAEIELDMGRLLDGRKSLRLYPGQNVLFAGTMNEDESTQALSDKVIDRASVLRFWRPKKTNPITTAPPQSVPTNGVTLASWKRWRRPITDLGPHATEVGSWIDQINNALTLLGRPFAFRVDRAIRSYVANYPRWVANWHKHAMADQVEQRIFPKLRGIEPDQTQNALRAIGVIIDQLEDDALKVAFRESWENQPTFLFRGVLRDERE
ncbi:MAG TPA: AAA family ATPase [Verrucomicrobiota bacterium]|nr:AAA family ATPase [Verrucomicrobiota bacterium]HQL76573.1 AAA family ATPase [Verrucomicrobiota bacterium]